MSRNKWVKQGCAKQLDKSDPKKQCQTLTKTDKIPNGSKILIFEEPEPNSI